MASKIKVRVKLKGDVAEVKSLMMHPMETGSRKDPDSGATIPAHHIKELTFTHNGNPVMLVHCSTAVSRDPYFSFSFKGAKSGDTVGVSWVDNLGETDSTEAAIG
ncbi:MAG: thiosulfate oxidation carrier complex protein SoxZ [Gammaproteobacteria bacterium]|jgi:sulfur-oxidizing protein SoxZ